MKTPSPEVLYLDKTQALESPFNTLAHSKSNFPQISPYSCHECAFVKFAKTTNENSQTLILILLSKFKQTYRQQELDAATHLLGFCF